MRPYYYLGNGKALTQLSEGYPFFVNTNDAGITTWIILGGTWENFVDDILCGVTRAGDHVLDAGANMGYYSVKLGYRVGPSGTVTAFEPNPELFPFLRANVDINGLSPRVTVHQLALSDTRGTIPLNFTYSNMGGGSLLAQSGQGFSSHMVEMVRGDDVIGPDVVFDVMKFDVEGYEPLAAMGLSGAIERSAKAAIVVEVSAQAWAHFGDFREIFDRFVCGRRQAFGICHDGMLEPIDLSDAQALEALASSTTPLYVLLLPEDHWAIEFVQSRCRPPVEPAYSVNCEA